MNDEQKDENPLDININEKSKKRSKIDKKIYENLRKCFPIINVPTIEKFILNRLKMDEIKILIERLNEEIDANVNDITFENNLEEKDDSNPIEDPNDIELSD